MAIDVTPGSATAVAYDTAANADAYFLARGITTWTGTEAAKEETLIRGADYLERTYLGEWIGLKATEDQSLAWPRTDAVDVDGYSYDVDEIPVSLKYANFEAALLVLTDTELEPVLERGGSVKVEEFEAAVVRTKTEYFSGAPSRSTFTSIDGLVSGLITGRGSTVDLLRV